MTDPTPVPPGTDLGKAIAATAATATPPVAQRTEAELKAEAVKIAAQIKAEADSYWTTWRPVVFIALGLVALCIAAHLGWL